MALYSSAKLKNSSEENETSDEHISDDSCDELQAGNPGWADSIAKVLSTKKPKNRKSVVLSRAKKINDRDKAKEENYGFEVDGGIKDEKALEENLETSSNYIKNQKISLRIKPSWKDADRERALRKIATRGVVQLFNAVRIQQKDLQYQLDAVGPLDSRKEAVLNNINKRKFLDVLMSGKRSKSEQLDNPVKEEYLKEENESSESEEDGTKKKTEWSVLRHDFMTNKKIKHWDEEEANSEENSNDEN